MMRNRNQFLRFDGRLWENMVFEPLPGWETERVARRAYKGDGSYLVELLNEKGERLVSVSPEVDFTAGCTSMNDQMLWVRVVAYVPLHPESRRLRFRRGEQLLYETEVAERPPQITIDGVEPQRGGRLRLRWQAQATGRSPLTFTVVYIAGRRRAFPLARALPGDTHEYTVDPSRLLGDQEARLAVLASDGLRSAFAVSEPFAVAAKPPRLWIQSPQAEATFPPDQPIDLCGQALDVASASLPHKGLIWLVDGDVVSQDVCLAVASGLEPGPHKITLAYAPQEKVVAEQTVVVHIAERNKHQKRFLEMMARIA